MKFFKSFILTVLFFSQYSAAQTTLDWDKLNTEFVDIVQIHTDTFDFLESGSISVDKTKSDLSNGALSFNFEFKSTELNLLGSNSPQTIGILGQLDIQTAELGAMKKVDFEASLTLEADSLAILNHVNQLFTDCAIIDPQNTFQFEICKYVDNVAKSRSAFELKEALESLRRALLSLFPLAVGSTDDFQKILQQLNIVEQLDSVLVSAIVNNLELFGLNLSAELSLTFSNESIKVQAIGSSIVTNSSYLTFISTTESVLLGLQNKNQDTLDMIFTYTFLVFDLLEGIFF